jgi:hypothetical protein
MKEVIISSRLKFGRREWIFLGAFSLMTWLQGVMTSLQLQGLLVTPDLGAGNGTEVVQ